MQSCINLIKKLNLIEQGDTVGIAFSGGSDSMALLHFLHSIKDKIGFKLIAIHINHGIRKQSEEEAEFAKSFCAKLNVPIVYKKLNVLKQAKELGQGIEECARSERYKVFDEIIKRGKVNKIALAHHQSDQAETIMLNILRGSGVKGACGMDYVRGAYIRPLLDTSKAEIMQYIKQNNLTFVTDQTNACNDYSRNYLRNVIFVELNKKFNNVEKAFCEFAKNCKEEQKALNEMFDYTDFVLERNRVSMPNKYFVTNITVAHNAIKKAINILGEYKDFSKKHTELIADLINKNNGTKINLPKGIIAVKDYNYITLLKQQKQKGVLYLPVKDCVFNFKNKYKVEIKQNINYITRKNDILVLDFDKLPKGCVIRTRQDGDVFKKFGGGEKKLKEFFIDKKVPSYMRDDIPLIALCKKVYCVIGYEISDYVKCDESTKNFLVVTKL